MVQSNATRVLTRDSNGTAQQDHDVVAAAPDAAGFEVAK